MLHHRPLLCFVFLLPPLLCVMAASTLSQLFGDQNKGQEVSRHEIQAANANVLELRALHAVLMQGNSPANLRFAAASPVPNSAASSHLSAQDYPVFTPVSLIFSFFLFSQKLLLILHLLAFQ